MSVRWHEREMAWAAVRLLVTQSNAAWLNDAHSVFLEPIECECFDFDKFRKDITVKLKIFTDSTFSFWGTMPEQKLKIGKASINRQFRCDDNYQKYVVAIKPIIKSIITYKNQIKGTRWHARGSCSIK